MWYSRMRMNTQLDPAGLERQLLDKLLGLFPKAEVHINVNIIHADKWWTCHVYTGPSTRPEEVITILRRAEMELFIMWPQPMSYVRECSIGNSNCSLRDSNLIVWLPVSPERTLGDFAKFYPGQQRSLTAESAQRI